MTDRFVNRTDAGQRLAKALLAYAGRRDLVVLALPRGGVPVAFEVALLLGAPLDVFVVRKLGVPGHEELAMGAIASGGIRVLNPSVVEGVGVPEDVIEQVTAAEREELQRREREYRGDRPLPDLCGRTVILIDDGLATGATMRAAIAAVRTKDPARIVVAVPTAPYDTCVALRREADDVVCLVTPEPFIAVGGWYDDFRQVSDEEVRGILDRAAAAQSQA